MSFMLFFYVQFPGISKNTKFEIRQFKSHKMQKHSISLFFLISLFLSFTSCGSNVNENTTSNAVAAHAGTAAEAKTKTKKAKPMKDPGMYAEMKTNKGTIILKLEFEKVPLTVANFVGLAEGEIENQAKPLGTKYYDGLTFHRVIANFMIQGGDPEGSGRGGPGYKFRDEIDASLKHDRAGVLSMANAGPATNGSQFFITHNATPWLDGKHAVFGYVVDGQDVVNAIQQGDQIESLNIVRKGKEAKKFDAAEYFAANK